MRQEMLYEGDLQVGERRTFGQVWHKGGTAVLYERPQNSVGGVMKHATVELVDGQMVAMGDVDGEPAVWRAVVPERTLTAWMHVDVELPSGTLTDATVTVTNHRTTITAPGTDISLPGARVRLLGGRSARVEQPAGPDLAMTLPKRGCGCGGRK